MSARLVHSPSVATWVSFVARALSIFVLAPIVLATFPPPEAAFWFVLVTLQGMQLLFGSSIGAGFIRALGYALGGAKQVESQAVGDGTGEPNLGLYSEIWATMGRAYLLLAVTTLMFLTALAVWSVPEVLRQTTLTTSEGLIATAAFVIGGTLRAYVGRHVSFLFASDRIPKLRWTEAIYWSVAFFGSVWALAIGVGIVGLALIYQGLLVLGLFWTIRLTHKDIAQRDGFNRQARFSFDVLKQLWPAFWRSGLGVALMLLATQCTGLYFARIGEPDEVAAYLFAMSLMRPMMQFAQVPFSTKLPTLARLQAAGDRQAQVAMARRGMALSNVLLCLMALGIGGSLSLLSGLDLFETPVAALLWATISVAAFAERSGAMHLQYYSTTNHILWHWANGITAVLYLGFAALMFPHLSALSFPMAHFLACAMFYSPYTMYLSYRAFKLEWPSFELSVTAVPGAVLLLYFFSVLSVAM